MKYVRSIWATPSWQPALDAGQAEEGLPRLHSPQIVLLASRFSCYKQKITHRNEWVSRTGTLADTLAFWPHIMRWNLAKYASKSVHKEMNNMLEINTAKPSNHVVWWQKLWRSCPQYTADLFLEQSSKEKRTIFFSSSLETYVHTHNFINANIWPKLGYKTPRNYSHFWDFKFESHPHVSLASSIWGRRVKTIFPDVALVL